MSTGRTTEPRTVTCATTNSSSAVTAASGTFSAEDQGRSITGTGLPAGTTVLTVTSDTAITLSANATASGSITATLGPATAAVGYVGWSPETPAEAATYSVAARNGGAVSPGQQTNNYTSNQQRGRG